MYLKTLAGLKRVHAILRRLDDDFCDPVELRADSALGVPGLLGAVRTGNVVVANALGSGVLESAAWLGFLPAHRRAAAGRKLSLPSVATWWCGERPAFEYVLAKTRKAGDQAHLSQIRSSIWCSAATSTPTARGHDCALRARPYAYVAQEHLAFSQAPVW